MLSTRPPAVDLVITFWATRKVNPPKQTHQDSKKAEQQYKRLIQTLENAGLKAVGRRGESLGHLFVFVKCPPRRIKELAERERRSDLLSGSSVASALSVQALSPADRIRLVHTFITSTTEGGGIGVSPEYPEWDLVESLFALKDREFNEAWAHIWNWKIRRIPSVELEGIRNHFGDSLAFYFTFLTSYTCFLVVPATLGVVVHFFFPPYSLTYSILLCIWSVTFVEWWRVHERNLTLRPGTGSSFRAEKRRAQYKPGMSWWVRGLRVLASVPVILLFAGLISTFLAGIFVLEAFVTELYQGPGKQVITFLPTLLPVLLVPGALAIHEAVAVKFTNWENHAHKSTHATSLNLKTFVLSAIVAYLGLSLSAFVYMPFGEGVMKWVQAWLFNHASASNGFQATLWDMLNGTVISIGKDATTLGSGQPASKLWYAMNVRTKLNPGRLSAQMFTYMVTLQAGNKFTGVGLPFVLQYVDSFLRGKTKGIVSRDAMEERTFLDSVCKEVALPEYEVSADYSQVVIQFGYVAVWSAIWPLAGVVALLNNILQVWSDAFKMTVHHRRPLPSRTATIGPWIDALTFLAWLGTLTNSALVYLFSPQLLSLSTASSPTPSMTKELLLKAILVSLVASHAFSPLQYLIRYVVQKMCWRGGEKDEKQEREERKPMEKFPGSAFDMGASNIVVKGETEEELDTTGFWERDDGFEEIQRISKEA